MEFQPRQIVLVDTNVILEAHQTGCWVPLAEYFALHTVAKVVKETQTGYQNRDPEHWIDEAVLRGQLAHVESIDAALENSTVHHHINPEPWQNSRSTASTNSLQGKRSLCTIWVSSSTMC